MVMWLLDQRWVAVFWFVKIVFCAEDDALGRTVYTLENRNARLTFHRMEEYIGSVYINQTKEDGTQDNVLVIQDEHTVEKSVGWASRIHNVTIHDSRLEFTLKNVSLGDAGSYLCLDVASEPFVKCGCMLVVVAKPNRPVISQVGDNLAGLKHFFRCKHSSRSKPSNSGLNHIIKWTKPGQSKKGPKPPPDKYGVNDEGEFYVKNVQMSEKGQLLTCVTADVYPNLTTYLYSDQSQPFWLNPQWIPLIMPTTRAVRSSTTMRRTTTAPKRKYNKHTESPREITEESSLVAWVALFAVLIIILVVFFVALSVIRQKRAKSNRYSTDSASVKIKISPSGYSRESRIY